MKICPKCSHSNGDDVPTCVFCNHLIVNEPSMPAPDPDDPEFEQNAIREKRRVIMRDQLRNAALLYAFAIAFTSLTSCMAYDRIAYQLPFLGAFFASGLLVAFLIIRRLAGQFFAPFLQGAITTWLIFQFEMTSPLMFFLIGAHVFFPVLFSIWIDLIYDANR